NLTPDYYTIAMSNRQILYNSVIPGYMPSAQLPIELKGRDFSYLSPQLYLQEQQSNEPGRSLLAIML
ncbi:MAG: hypothetical protein ACYSR9_09345, partial [Planctomycetota bacterium]